MLHLPTPKKGSTLTVCLEGKLDRNTYEMAGERINSEMVGMEKLVLDMEKLVYISSAGLRVLVDLRKRISNRENMVVKNVQQDVLDVLALTGLQKYLI